MDRRFIPLVAALVLAGACTNVKEVPEASNVRADIDAVNEELVGCWNSGEYECVAAAFTEDGWQMMPNAPARVGTEDIQRYWQLAFGWGQWQVSLSTSILETSGPVAIERGKYTIQFAADAAAPPGRPSSQDRGNFVTHWRLDSAGRWRIAAQALVSEVPARAVPAQPVQPGQPYQLPDPGQPPAAPEEIR